MDSTNKKFSFFKSFMKKSVSFFSSGKELSSRNGVTIAGKVLRYTLVPVFLLTGLAGMVLSYINPMPYIASVFPIVIDGTIINITQVNIQNILTLLTNNLMYTVGTSIILVVAGLALTVRDIKAAPMGIIRLPVKIYRGSVKGRDWLLAKISYLNEESAKWKTTFNILKSPYSLLRACGFSPQMALGLIFAGSTVGTGVVVNETILADRSFKNGDAGVYAAPVDIPSAKLEEMLAFRKDNKDDNTLRIVLGVVPVREIKIENVSVGTVYANSSLPASTTHHSSGGTNATPTAVLIGGTVVSGGTDTFLEVGEMILEKSRCSQLYFDNTTAHTINVIGNASDGQSINVTPGTSRMRAIGGGHHQAEAMVTSGGSYDRIHIDAPTSDTNGKIGKLQLSNLYTEGGACVFDRLKIGTLTIELNEIGIGNGFDSKEFKIHQSVTAANWNVSDNVEVSIGTPTETLSNE